MFADAARCLVTCTAVVKIQYKEWIAGVMIDCLCVEYYHYLYDCALDQLVMAVETAVHTCTRSNLAVRGEVSPVDCFSGIGIAVCALDRSRGA